jgi:hypothetical protein
MKMGSERGLGGIAVIVALLVAALLYLGYFRMQSTTSETQRGIAAIDNSRAFACKTNRQSVEREIQMWLVNHPGEVASFAALESDGAHIATCPDGGTYSLDGFRVRCSKHD